MITTILFDFDGTLANCKELHHEAFRKAVQKVCPGAEYDDELVEGRPTREKIRMLHTMGYTFNGDKLNDIKQMITQENLPEFIKFDQELHDEIKRISEKYVVCLATNATEVFINRSLEIMGINQYFSKINTATDFPAKPDPHTFFDCMKFSNSSPQTTVIFEDSPVGIQCAKATGCHVEEVLDVSDTIKKIRNY